MSETHFLRHFPSTEELLRLLKVPKSNTSWDRRNRALNYVMYFAIVVLVICWSLLWLELIPSKPGALVGLGSLGLVMLTWTIAVIIDVARTVPSLLDPATEMARQFDRECQIENEILPRLQLLPPEIFAQRHRRLEWQLGRWEKWLDVARLMGMLGPLVIFVCNGLFDKRMLPEMVPSIELLVSATLTGVLIGAVSLRSGIKRLQWVSYLMRRASERKAISPELRSRLRKRR